MLQVQIFGNSILQWASLVGILGLSVVAGRVTIWRLNKAVHSLFDERDKNVDDLLTSAFEQPLFLMLILCGVLLGFNILTVSPTLADWFRKIWQFLFTITTTWMVSRLYDIVHFAYLVEQLQKKHAYFDDQLMSGLRTAIKVVIWVLGFILALNNVGYDVTAVMAGLAIGGLAVALAAQDTVANLFGGVTIFAQQPFKMGDRIEVQGINGWVKLIGLRTTKLEDVHGQEITVPNKFLSQYPVKNTSGRSSYVVNVILPLNPAADPETLQKFTDSVKNLLEHCAGLEANRGVGIQGFERNAINVEFWYEIKRLTAGNAERYSDDYTQIVEVRSQINLQVLAEMKAWGLEYAAPAQRS
jgi:MscS family membrane protein